MFIELNLCCIGYGYKKECDETRKNWGSGNALLGANIQDFIVKYIFQNKN